MYYPLSFCQFLHRDHNINAESSVSCRMNGRKEGSRLRRESGLLEKLTRTMSLLVHVRCARNLDCRQHSDSQHAALRLWLKNELLPQPVLNDKVGAICPVLRVEIGQSGQESSSNAERCPKSGDFFLSILSIECRNRFYWADRAETAERAESKESPVFMRI
jgi:hypothetical protein